jgi:proteasome lid subunit RPN8/RPN11
MAYLFNGTMEVMFQHALAAYPEECCGVISGDSQKQNVHLCRNIQNRFHAEDPERFPRNGRTAYFMDRDEVEKIFASAELRGEKIIAFYHSHTNNEAYFSDIDKEAQTILGEPEFPETIQVVISVIRRRICGMKWFKWDKDDEDFVPIEEYD